MSEELRWGLAAVIAAAVIFIPLFVMNLLATPAHMEKDAANAAAESTNTLERARDRLSEHLKQIESSQPNIVVDSCHIVTTPLWKTTPASTAYPFDRREKSGEADFAQVWFKNEPAVHTEASVARKVVAEILFHDISLKGDPLVVQMIGRWADTPEVARLGELTREMHEVEIAPNPLPRKLDIALKYRDDLEAYAYNNESVLKDARWRDQDKVLLMPEYKVIVRLQGVGVDQEHSFLLRNDGSGKSIQLTSWPEPSAGKAPSSP